MQLVRAEKRNGKTAINYICKGQTLGMSRESIPFPFCDTQSFNSNNSEVITIGQCGKP